ncbi:MAG TPA: S9 family peptidase [Candidatus Acidoferrales bacterium]|nr:S9 family peptidase [Candidatus Acidoferrales bacterium]
MPSCLLALIALAWMLVPIPAATRQLSGARGGFVSDDLHRLRDVGDAQISPDGRQIAYTIVTRSGPRGPSSQLWIMDVATGNSRRVGNENESGGNPLWSADGRHLAYIRGLKGKSELVVVDTDGSDPQSLAELHWTNGPLPSTGERISWSPDGSRIAFVSSTPGPETAEATGDPMVFTRYLYKPTASEGVEPFQDNRRTHIFVADLATKQVRQLTTGNYYEHSIDWSRRGDEILFVSNHEPDPDLKFNYDIFTVHVGDGSVRQLTFTKAAEYRPRWSPDGTKIVFQGTKRPLTSSETTMEDTHIWTMNADGSDRREVGAGIDNRQGTPEWSPDGNSVIFSVQEGGDTHLYRLGLSGGQPQPQLLVGGSGRIGSFGSTGWSVAKNGALAYVCATPADGPELYLRQGDSTRQLTQLNAEVFAGRVLAPVEKVDFPSFDGLPAEAFLTEPASLDPNKKYPMIVLIHGGPHGAQGSEFNLKAQIYASHGYATLMVNYRGSTGYGQKFADAIFGDQDGAEARDVLAGVDVALAQFPWIDPARMGIEGVSYGGQLTDWIITQTNRFRAAIPGDGISNLISFNFLSYYHDYLAAEFGEYPEQGNLMDLLWQRSAMRYVANVRTPVLFIHGLNDNDVPTEEAEQYYIALKEVGVETVLVLYPREGHGLRETSHIIDDTNRSIAWYDRHFAQPAPPPTAARMGPAGRRLAAAPSEPASPR